MQMNTNDLAQGFGKFKQPGNEPWRNSINKASAILMLIGLRDKSEIRITIPNILSQKNEKGIGIARSFWAPISTFLLWVNDMALEDFLVRINESTVLYSAQLLFVDLVNLRTYMAIIQVDSVNLVLLYQLDQLVE